MKNSIDGYEMHMLSTGQPLAYKPLPQFWITGTDPIGDFIKPTPYDPDFVFEVNGKKYVMQEEAFPKYEKLTYSFLEEIVRSARTPTPLPAHLAYKF